MISVSSIDLKDAAVANDVVILISESEADIDNVYVIYLCTLNPFLYSNSMLQVLWG